MGRGKNDCWSHVTKVENGKKWICKYCNQKFSGGASRIEAHLGGKGGGIRRCSNYRINQEDYNNLASTSSNPPQAQVVINTIDATHDEGVNGSRCIESVFGREINQLKQLILDLECEKTDIKKQLQLLESRGKKRKRQVDIWLEELVRLIESVENMNNLNDIHEINKLIKHMKQHKEDKPLTLSTEFIGETLNINIKKVLKLLEDDQVFVIGIYGMGGVGKTLLATLVENEVKRKDSFENVFWITISENLSISKLQHDIAKRIGVKLDEDDERARANNLSLALETKEKLVLILDDVWEYIDLEKVGIPRKVNGIKVILTTRLKHVCHQMDCEPNHMIQIVPLYTNGEDWELFQVNLGHNGAHVTLSPEIEKTARDIVDICEGLPLGIRVMARTMKGIDDIHRWKHAYSKLKKLEMGQEVEEEVFKVLKRSYDNLMEKDLQNCFLYCALLSIDHEEFDKDGLIMKLVDNGLINGNMCLEEILDEGNTILNKLEAHSLMSFDESLAWTHRLVKDMACYILRKSMVQFDNELTKIPLTHEWAVDLEIVHFLRCSIEEIPEDMSPYCPRLSTLIINKVSISRLSESFFKYLNSLTTLDLSYNERLESLPNSITKLRSLVSLIIRNCDSLKHLPPLGELQALSRLDISKSSLEEAPQGLDKLLNLKWLDLSHNNGLYLELGTLSNLTKMQYLDLRDTRAVITVKDVQRMNMLQCFGGIFDSKDYHYYVQKLLDFRFELKTYHLIFRNEFGESRSDLWNYTNLKNFVPCDPKIRTIQFEDCDDFTHILPKDHTCLNVYENNHWICLCDALSYNTSSSLRKIYIYDCQQLESLFCLSDSCSFCTKIHNLEVLELFSLASLTIVCKDAVDVRQSLSPSDLFSNLKEFSISYCHLIEKVLTPQIIRQLQYLETMYVRYCNSLNEIFAVTNGDDDGSSNITLPRLTKLNLNNLPNLKIVYKGSIPCGIFSCLQSLYISNCHSIEKLLPPQFDQQLPNLETISVRYCDSMKEIFEKSNSDDNSSIALPKLRKLDLWSLPELKIVCKGSISCECSPEFHIYDCPNLEMHPTIEIKDFVIPLF